ncbi:MAG TPA: hypothetical protein VGL08_21045, partial [Paraburkholderia sp.]
MVAHRMRFRLHFAALSSVAVLAACGGSGDNGDGTTPMPAPAPPSTPGFVDNAPIPPVPAFVDNIATNQRGDARFATLNTNAGVRLFSRYLDLWQPLTELVDAGAAASANG